ncbi:hypothetical protein EVG20_g2572 [Dentipellis fragilis]|uniref:Uncharacterized protein n=1 Tax=Dentipellis fragilis TaxID=205917 RepID=A0A4Y9Z7G1_9AGAM|nr:hypothetical protein EVG20_g2572 [Dentipellis fragilis]
MPRVPRHKRRSKAQKEQLRRVQALRHAHAHAAPNGSGPVRDSDAAGSSSSSCKLSGSDNKPSGSGSNIKATATTDDHNDNEGEPDRPSTNAEIRSALRELDAMARTLRDEREWRDRAAASGLDTQEEDRALKKAERLYKRLSALLRVPPAAVSPATPDPDHPQSMAIPAPVSASSSASPANHDQHSRDNRAVAQLQTHPIAPDTRLLEALSPRPAITTRASVTALAENPLSKPELIRALVQLGIDEARAPRVVQIILEAALEEVVFPDDIV